MDHQSNYELTLSNVSRNFNIDNNKVGWYYISNSNDYLSYEIFRHNLLYVADKKCSIFMVYDTIAAKSGKSCPFKTYFISEAWLKALKSDDYTDLDLNQIKKFNLKFDKMYTEVPLKIKVNPLTRLFLTQHEKTIRNKLDQIVPLDMDTNLAKSVKNTTDA